MKNYRKAVLALLALFFACYPGEIYSEPAQADRLSPGKIQGVQAAEKILKFQQKYREGTYEELPAEYRCHLFAKFAATEIDTGQLGADEIYVRWREKKQTAEKLCDPRSTQRKVGLENHEDTILGAAADFLFTRSADGFGEEREFKIYDTTTGKLVYRARYQETQDFLVSSAPNTLSLEYFGRVRLYCDLSQQKSACWRKTLVINQIPLAVELRPPDCAPVYQTAEFKARPQLVHEPAAVQLFIQVRVEDIRHPVVTYLGSQVSCIAAP